MDKPTITFRLGKDFYDKLDDFTGKVIKEGFHTFAEEFKNIDDFYCRAQEDNSDRDDKSFRRQPKEFYLLETLYYKIHDEHNRPPFNKTKDTVLILPQCLAERLDRCKRKETKFGKICTKCHPDCTVKKIMDIADQYGIEGYFSKRQLTEQLEKINRAKPGLGVIGIACILTLASGMRSAREAGVPSRGVFLNFTGCDHWADSPFPTETAVDKLKSILEEKYGLPNKASE